MDYSDDAFLGLDSVIYYAVNGTVKWHFSTAWYDSARLVTARHGSIRVGLRFHGSLVPSGGDYSHIVIVAPPLLP